MNWFKNLNARPRLMLSFGLLLFLTLVMGCVAISALSRANDRLTSLYKLDLQGVVVIDDLAINRTSIGGYTRDAVLNTDNPAAVAENEDKVISAFAKMHADLDEAKGLIFVQKGIAAMDTIRADLPGYEQVNQVIFQRVKANDLAGAKVALLVANGLAAPIIDAVDGARAMKKKLTAEKYDTSIESYQSARSCIIGFIAASSILGFILSILIARGFSAPLSLVAAALEQVVDGDLTVTVRVHTKDEVGQMATALNTALDKLRSTLQEVAESAANANTSSQKLTAAAQIAGGAEEQAASLEGTSASLERITAAVRQSADSGKQASQLATVSRESADQGQEVVSSAIAAMAEINVASAKIFDIISTINEITFQANLLAVDAAVEAARAGAEGCGFAVVATEVRSLAQRSAEAAKEIRGLIQDSLQKVEKGTELVSLSGATLQGMIGSVKRVTDIVGEIAAAAAEQSTGVDQVNTALTEMDHVTQSNSARTEELSSAAQAFAEQAAKVTQLVGQFKLGDCEQSRGDNGRKSLLKGQGNGTLLRPKAAANKLAYSASNERRQSEHSIVLVASPAGSNIFTITLKGVVDRWRKVTSLRGLP